MTIQITIPPPGWLWVPIALLVGAATVTLAHATGELHRQAQGYRQAKDSMEALIQTGTHVWLAPPIDTVRRRGGR